MPNAEMPKRRSGEGTAVVTGATIVGGPDSWEKVKSEANTTVWSTDYKLAKGQQVDTLLVDGRRAIRAR